MCLSVTIDYTTEFYFDKAAIGDADAKSLVIDWPLVATSPNMDQIPFIPTGNLTMRPLQDGRYGYLDFSLWPQVHSAHFAHRPFVLKHDANNSGPDSVMWWTPTEADGFERCEGPFGHLGRLARGRMGQFESVKIGIAKAVNTLNASSSSTHPDLKYYYINFCLGITRLKHNPYTVCDLILDVAQTQRHYHDTAAYLRYVSEGWAQSLHGDHDEIREVNTSLMGCWTRDLTVVQRYRRAGVPIYYLRSEREVDSTINIEHPPSTFVRSLHIVNTDWSFHDQISPFPTVYSGPPSDDMHAAASRQVKLLGIKSVAVGIDFSQDSRDLIPIGFISDVNKSNARSKRRSGKGNNRSM